MRRLSLCFIAAFIVIYDQQKVIAASTLVKRDVSGTYTTKYDNVDVNKIVTSKRLMNNYAKCLLDKGPCTPEGKELKIYLPDALQTKCSKCSERQREIAGIVLAHLVRTYRGLFDELLDKYDPDGNFRKEYEGGNDDEEEEEEDRR